jgi:hypothetical protein
MKLKSILTYFCFLSCGLVNAQAEKSIPGFLGSRNAVCIKVMPNIAFDHMFESQLLSPSINLNIERAISRRGSLTFSIGKANNIITAGSYDRFTNVKNRLVVSSKNASVKVDRLDGEVQYSNTYFSIAKSYYNLQSGSIAPQGKYFKVGYTLNLLKIKKDNLTYILEYGGSLTHTDGKYKTRSLGSLNMETGSKRFISRHLFFQKAFAINIPFQFWGISRNNTFFNVEDYNESNLIAVVSVVQTLNVSLAFGYAF